MIKRYTCREHPGGIFSKQAGRGRAPVRCKPEFPCDKVDAPQATPEQVAAAVARVEVVSEHPDFNAMTNPELKAYARKHFSTITKITSRAQMIRAMEAQAAKQTSNRERQLAKSVTRPAESNAQPVAAVNDSLPLAMRAKTQLEAVGWTVKGRAWIDASEDEANGAWAEVTASRGTEMLIMKWHGGCIVEQNYSMEYIKPSDNGIPPHDLHFNPDELTDSELVRMIKGMKVTWWNTLASSRESAIIAGSQVSVEHIFNREDSDIGKRIVKFVDHNGGGFRAFHVSALMKVG